MKQSACFSLIRSELNEFLFAPIGPEQNGMTLSVISGLARLGIDPWEEAARLANLPDPAATEALALTIAGMSGGPWQPVDTQRIAARLVRLLPKHGIVLPPETTKSGPAQKAQRQAPVWLIWVLLGALLMVTVATHRAALFGSDRAEAPISTDARQ